MMFVLALCFTLCLVCAQAAPESDRVIILPGLPVQPSFRHYSGYLKAGGDRHLHYWFLEASEVDPKTAPVVLWLNGGPGCSSMEGLLRENGPFRVNDQTILDVNPYSWNREANMLYLEAPAGVGYSYADNGNTTTDDNQVADDNHLALTSFFTKFPEYAGRDFFITGESYAGVYIPTLAVRVLQDKNMKLKGIAIGNGLSSYHLNTNSLIYYIYYHGIMGDDDWSSLFSACCDKCSGSVCDILNNTSPACTTAVNLAQSLINGLDVYNMFAPCHGGIPQSSNKQIAQGVDLLNRPSTQFGKKLFRKMRGLTDLFYKEVVPQRHEKHVDQFYRDLFKENRGLSSRQMALNNLHKGFVKAGHKVSAEAGEDIPCTNDTALTNYMNDPLVKYAIHVNTSLPTFSICSLLDYHTVYDDLSDVYKQHLLPSGIRILLYNGDADMACNYLGDQWFLDRFGLKIRISRRPWYFQDPVEGRQIGGYAKQWDKVTFITVRGAGHMVPEDKPVQGFTLFQNFLKGKDF